MVRIHPAEPPPSSPLQGRGAGLTPGWVLRVAAVLSPCRPWVEVVAAGAGLHHQSLEAGHQAGLESSRNGAEALSAQGPPLAPGPCQPSHTHLPGVGAAVQQRHGHAFCAISAVATGAPQLLRHVLGKGLQFLWPRPQILPPGRSPSPPSSGMPVVVSISGRTVKSRSCRKGVWLCPRTTTLTPASVDSRGRCRCCSVLRTRLTPGEVEREV